MGVTNRATREILAVMTLASIGTGCRSSPIPPLVSAETEDGEGITSTRHCVPEDPAAELPSIGACDVVGSGSRPTIDDFEDGDLETHPIDERRGGWFVYTDETAGCVEMNVELEGSASVIHVRGDGFSRWGAGFGVSLRSNGTQPEICLYDASAYAGVRFRARGNTPLRMSVATRASTFVSLGGACPDGEGCYDRHGHNVTLTETWQTFEFDFCSFTQEGWGTPLKPLDPKEITQLTFHARRTGEFDVWFDDLEFIPAATPHPASCGVVCPRDRIPAGVSYDPTRTPWEGGAPGLSVFTFEQPTPDCGGLVRRYLAHVPERLGERTDAPLVIVLPGTSADAESMHDFMTGRRFVDLADRDGFVVVYANAAPGPWTAPERPNGGRFSLDDADLPQVDDLAYLELLVADLVERGHISGANPRFLAGHSIGGGLALAAALADPERYLGIAAIMPFHHTVPPMPPNLEASALARVFIAYAHDDPGLPADYHVQLAALVQSWASALGLGDDEPTRTPHEDLVVEGEGYTGDDPVALRTRNSHATRIDFGPSHKGAALRVVEFDRAGHFWPMASPYEDASLLAAYGHRNRDLDMSEALWSFFAQAVGS